MDQTMNKKFKELAKQAGLQQTKWADSNTEDVPVRIWQESLNNPGSLEKFAESIVKECAEFTDPGMKPFLFKHFGVEE
jgi:hypothetical protein